MAEVGPVPGWPRTSPSRQSCSYATRCVLGQSMSGPSIRRDATLLRALDLGVHDDALARELLLLRAQAETERRSTDQARVDVRRAEASVAAGDRRHEALSCRLLGILHQRDGDLPAARAELGASVELFRELGDDIELAASLRERGFAEVFGGSLEGRRVAAR